MSDDDRRESPVSTVVRPRPSSAKTEAYTDPGDGVEAPRGGAAAPGEMVDHYRILRQLGRGGTGLVYLARDTSLGRKVALKFLTEEAVDSREILQRFLFEAKATAQLNHPNIVTVYGVGMHEGVPYLAMEYLEGINLRARIHDGSLSIPESIRTCLAIADALAEAHRHEILHRDLKPENVMIPRDGRIRVVDFGLATRIRSEEPPPEPASLPSPDPDEDSGPLPFLTEQSGIRGTPSYMAPEQWKARPSTQATDVWALGVMLYELVQGWLPFEAGNLHQLCALVSDQEPAVPVDADVPEPLARLIGACLAKNPDQRPDMEGVIEGLSEYVGGSSRTQEHPPFRGLLPFDERHADEFYGRTAEIVAFLERLREEPVLPVLGPSGAGKTSFVLAGVIPRLREQGEWRILRMRPGSRPLRSLAAQLLAPSAHRASSGARPSQGPDGIFLSQDSPSGSTGLSAGVLDEAEKSLARELRESPIGWP